MEQFYFLGILILFYTSVAFQVILTIFGSFRKHCSNKWFTFLLWSIYQLVDVVVTTVLGMITSSPTRPSNFDYYAPTYLSSFLLLHLGGPDSITALSLVDNQLCFRQTLQLLYRVGVAAYIHFQIFTLHKRLADLTISMWISRILMILAGISKYGERTWALHSANMDSLRDSMLPPPNPGPKTLVLHDDDDNHADVAEAQCISRPMPPEDEYASRIVAPTLAEEKFLKEQLDSSKAILLQGHHYFCKFRYLFVDLMVPYSHSIDSQRFFLRHPSEVAFQLIDVELSFMYDILFTKVSVLHTCLAWILRLLRLSALLYVFLLSYSYTTPIVTGSAAFNRLFNPFVWSLVQEIYEVIQILLSGWTVVWLNNHNFNRLSTLTLRLMLSCRWFVSKIIFFRGSGVKVLASETTTIWWYNNNMAQYNLLCFCFKNNPTVSTRILHLFTWGKSVHEWVERSRNTTYMHVSNDIKDFIYQQLKEMVQTSNEEIRRAEFHNHRGKWVMRRNDCREHNCLEELGWSVDVEFDRSILVWHVATDLCYYNDDLGLDKCEAATVLHVQVSKALSNYLLYLLLIFPFMLNNRIGKIRFQDTCAAIKQLIDVPKDKNTKKRKDFSFILQRKKSSLDEKQAKADIMKLLTSDAQVLETKTKSNESKSVLLEAHRLARLLQLYTKEKRWKIISGVWVEMLSYAARNCSGKHHAERLCDGGEFLTKIWLLMAHLGMVE